MRYTCVHCDHQFEADGGAAPKRCPACMRANGIEPLRQLPEKARVSARPERRARWLAALLAVCALGGLGYALSRRAAPAGNAGPAPLSERALRDALAAEQVDAGGLERLLLPDASIRKFAAQAAAGKSTPEARADALLAALRARAKAGAFVAWSLGEPRGTPVLTASQTLATIQHDGARRELYPLELAALLVAALRSLEVPALVAELSDAKGARAPLDGSGYLGYFVAALPGAGTAPPRSYDAYAGKVSAADSQARVLSDTTAVGAALALRAVHENVYLADPKRALESSSHALRLAPALPSVRTVRGVVVLTEKMVEQGLQEFQAARELRGDAARLHNLASVMLVTGELDKAQGVLSAALEKAPDFGAAHVTLATLLMLRGELDEAHAELERGEQLAPGLSAVRWGFAEYALRRGDNEQAVDQARRALAARPSFDAKLRFAALLRQAGKYDEMRRAAEQLLAQAPAYRRDELREVIGTVLGPTALEPVPAAEPDLQSGDLADLGGPKLELKLPAQGKLLGTGAEQTGNGSERAAKLRLQDAPGGLRLDLGAKPAAQ